jgi:transcriptional regulator with XRE-family HTH domain
MNNRIKEIIASEHLSDGEFADLVGIKRSTLSHCLSGRNDVSKDIITKIHNAYPYISINWLMFGEGESGISLKNVSTSNLFNSFEYSNTDSNVDSEYRNDLPLNTSLNPSQQTENQTSKPEIKVENISPEIEKIVYKEKKIEKIMIFYSDNTFEVFEK